MQNIIEKKDTMRTQKSDSQLQANFETVIQNLTQVAIEKKYIITASGENVDHIEYLRLKLDGLTNTGRKKVAKRLEYASKTKGLRRINSFFHFLHLVTGLELIKFDYCMYEKEIKRRRVEMVNAKTAYESALNSYKIIKGDFYK